MNEDHDFTADRLARSLGWASLALGGAQLAAPHTVRRLVGVDDSALARRLVPLVGARELLHAALLLGSERPARWAWTRVAGDAVDLTALGWALAVRRGDRLGDRLSDRLSNRLGDRWRRTAAGTAAVAVLTAADAYTTIRARRARRWPGRGLELSAAITIDRPRAEVYGYWHDLTDLPRFMTHLESVESVESVEGTRTRWTAHGPARATVAWEADTVEDRPDELIAWRSTGSSTVDNAGSVRFTDAPGDRGTELRVELSCHPPAGRAGAAFAKLLGEHPEQQVRDDLRRFKQVLETGEVLRSDGSPEGVRAARQAKQYAAQPMSVD